MHLKRIKLKMTVFFISTFPIRNKKEASNTPKPPGAAGIIKPIDQDKQNTTNMKITFRLLS